MTNLTKMLKSICSIFALGTLLTACATSTSPSDAYKGESKETIFLAGRKALREGNNTEAVKRFEALEVQYPFGADTESAQLYIIYAYYMKEDYLLAVVAADRFIRTHPLNPHVDYAYYLRGVSAYYQNIGIIERVAPINLANRDLSSIRKAFNDFAELIQRFPNSVYAPAAHQYMIYLRNILADHEYQVAKYYYARKAYVASANRASKVVAHYQGSPVVVDSLLLMINSYRMLRLPKLLTDAVNLYRYNNIRASVNP